MSIKTTLNYSPNFKSEKRDKKEIRFLIFHYTGMKTEKSAIKKLIDSKSNVSCHYLIKENGEILTLVPDLYIAWHAGISSWKNYKSLNKNSIGIEITNPGHKWGYKNFSIKQINSLIILSKYLIKKYHINKKNILGHSDIATNRKKDPGEKFPWQLLSKKNLGMWHNINNKVLKQTRSIKISKINQGLALKNILKLGYEKNKNTTCTIKAFQRRFRPELINGKIDSECSIISYKLLNFS